MCDHEDVTLEDVRGILRRRESLRVSLRVKERERENEERREGKSERWGGREMENESKNIRIILLKAHTHTFIHHTRDVSKHPSSLTHPISLSLLKSTYMCSRDGSVWGDCTRTSIRVNQRDCSSSLILHGCVVCVSGCVVVYVRRKKCTLL